MEENYINRSSWDEVECYLNAVASRVDPHDFIGVYGIPRGGSVLAAWLAHKLYLPLLSEPQPSCIIIDDICESGTTLRECLSNPNIADCNDCYVTVMYYRLDSYEKLVDYYFKEKEDNWIVFPWEQ